MSASSFLKASGIPRGIAVLIFGWSDIAGVLNSADWPKVLFIGSIIFGVGSIRVGISSLSLNPSSRGGSENFRSIDGKRLLRGKLFINLRCENDTFFFKTGSELLFNKVKPMHGCGMNAQGFFLTLVHALGVTNACSRSSLRYRSMVEYDDFMISLNSMHWFFWM